MKNIAWVLLLAGCSTPPPERARPAERPEPEVAIQAESPEWRKITEELLKGRPAAEQQQLEITNHLLHGGRFLDARMYRSALREFENAEFKIRNMPYDVKAMNDLLPKVREMIARAKSSLRD